MNSVHKGVRFLITIDEERKNLGECSFKKVRVGWMVSKPKDFLDLPNTVRSKQAGAACDWARAKCVSISGRGSYFSKN